MDNTGAVRKQGDLAEMVEMLLDKGVVVNADIAVSVGDTELLGIEIRAAVASFETAARYGLEFPEGTDRERIEAATEQTGASVRDEEEPRSLGVRPGRAETDRGEDRDEDRGEDDRDEGDRERADAADGDAAGETREEAEPAGQAEPAEQAVDETDSGGEPAEQAGEQASGGGQGRDDG